MEGAKPPVEWLVSQICEEFQCLPSEAVRELEEGIPGLVLDVMELRSYARAKASLDRAEKPADVPKTPMVEQVWLSMHELMRRRHSGETGRGG